MPIFDFILFSAILLCFFGFGLVLFTDFRGIASQYSARNRAVVQDLALKGHDSARFLVFGKSRKVGALIMILTGATLLLMVGALVFGSPSGDM